MYKRWPIEILEVVCYMNLSLLCLVTFFSQQNESKGIIINISVSITFVLFLGVLFYHTFNKVVTKLCKKYASKRQEIESNRNVNEASQHTNIVKNVPKNTFTKYNYELRESLLDHIYSEPTY